MFARKSTEEKRRVKEREQERAEVVQSTYDKFRILIIGRANAGKTTILQRTCNTTDEPVIYGKDGNMVSAIPLGNEWTSIC
jgi:GTPase SAR1 family protein